MWSVREPQNFVYTRQTTVWGHFFESSLNHPCIRSLSTPEGFKRWVQAKWRYDVSHPHFFYYPFLSLFFLLFFVIENTEYHVSRLFFLSLKPYQTPYLIKLVPPERPHSTLNDCPLKNCQLPVYLRQYLRNHLSSFRSTFECRTEIIIKRKKSSLVLRD